MTSPATPEEARSDTAEADALALETAAEVLESRAPRQSFVLAVLCAVLRKRAARMRAGR